FQGRALPSSDVYAVGVTALRLLTGVEPEDLPHEGLAIDVRAALGGSFDTTVRDALVRMLDVNPDRRASSITPLVAKIDKAAPKRESRERRGSEPPSFSANSTNQSSWGTESERRRAQEEARKRRDRWVKSREEM